MQNKQTDSLKLFLRLISVLFLLFFAGIGFVLLNKSLGFFSEHNFSALLSTDWDPENSHFGLMPFVYGTFVSALLALLISAPISILCALFIYEYCPKHLKHLSRFVIEVLASIPSIIYGMWGMFVLAPIIKDHLYPVTQKYFPNLTLFHGPSFGLGVMCATLVLAIMIAPFIVGLSIDIFDRTKVIYHENAVALGLTRFETIWLVDLGTNRNSILSIVSLALARAIGETMAVAMVIGNRPQIFSSFFDPGSTLSSLLAHEFAEATSSEHIGALSTAGLFLFVFSFFIYFISKFMFRKKK